jgi:hypothetical protein
MDKGIAHFGDVPKKGKSPLSPHYDREDGLRQRKRDD